MLGIRSIERNGVFSNIVDDGKRIVTSLNLKNTVSAVKSLNIQMITGVSNIAKDVAESLSPFSIAAMNKSIFSSLITNWDLDAEAETVKNRFLNQSEIDIVAADVENNAGDEIVTAAENETSKSTISDLTKLSYKEVYAVYKKVLRDPDLNHWDPILFVNDSRKSGLNAAVFVNDKTKEVNISFEGSHGFMKLLAENVLVADFLKEIRTASDDFSHPISEKQYKEIYDNWKIVLGADGVSDLQILAGKIPDQFYTAYSWFGKVMNHLKHSSAYSGYDTIITGHSLGGAMAQMVSAQHYLDHKEAIPTISLAGPGVLTQIETMNHKNFQAQDFPHIVNYITEADLVGEFQMDHHIGLTVPIPYTMGRNDEFLELKYRWGLNLYQQVTDIADIRLDRHEIGQQIDVFSGTNFSYPENKVIFHNENVIYRSNSKKQELIYAKGGNNVIYGGNGDNYLVGASGCDALYGGYSNDFIAGGAGHDTIFGGAGNNILYGGAGNDYLEGGNGNDELYGGSGNDTLVWSGGNDLLYGQEGDDVLILGKGGNCSKANGNATLKFDRENSGNDHVIFNAAAIDASNAHITLFMSDNILPSCLTTKMDGKNLYIQYGSNSSVALDGWSDVSSVLGNAVSISFGGSPISITAEFKIQNNHLVKVS